MLGKRLIKSNDSGGACINTVDLYNPFPDGGGVALYQLNGDATDVSGNYDGTATNVTYGAGQFGQAGVFNGSSSKITTSLTQTNTSAWSWSFWVNINAKPSSGLVAAILSNINGSAPFAGVTFLIDSPNFGIASNGSNIWTTNTINPSLSTWYHIAITYNGSNTITPYINGQSYGAISHTPSNGNTITIGDSDVSSWGSFNGSIDQVRIFNRALRPYEVEALYTEEYCTPTIVPSEHFNTVTYTGNSVNNREISNVGFQPDFTWIKNRSSTAAHNIFDSVRGAVNSLSSNTTGAEDTSPDFGFLASFESNGFTLGDGSGGAGYSGNWETNETGQDYVAWNFKAGGAAVTNTDGTITSQVSANTEAGFSVVSYTGNSTNSTVGHGLGNAPSVVIVKRRDFVGVWGVYHSSLANDKYLRLNETASAYTDTTLWNNTAPTDSVFHLGTNGVGNSNNTFIAYCFAEVEGFSNFGSYVGTGTTSGNVVVTGFEPAFVMVKRTDASGNSWLIVDNKRIGTGNEKHELFADTSSAESGGGYDVAFLENGFQMQTTTSNANASGASYIYMAFAADPTTIEPTLEDSFNTVLYSGNSSSSHSITGVGFQPDLTWIKNRTANAAQWITDSVRGAGNGLQAQSTDAELTSLPELMSSFNSDGFTVGYISNPTTNLSGNNYVAWNWKGAELPAINSNGSIPSVVSANPAAGFSIVSLTIPNDNTQSVGHGLDSAPSVIIMKARDAAESWLTYHSSVGLNKYLLLNSTAAEASYAGIWSDVNISTFTTLYHSAIGFPTRDVIAYCFAEVAGFSKFGSYTGNGSNQYVNLGFEPAFIMVKRTNGTGTWGMFDNKRGLSAPQPRLLANDSAAENTGTTYWASTDSTGFTVQGSSIYGTGDFIYMAFANQF